MLSHQSYRHLHVFAKRSDYVHYVRSKESAETVGYVEPHFRIKIKMNRFPVVLNLVQGNQVFVTVHTLNETIYRLNKFNTFLR